VKKDFLKNKIKNGAITALSLFMLNSFSPRVGDAQIEKELKNNRTKICAIEDNIIRPGKIDSTYNMDSGAKLKIKGASRGSIIYLDTISISKTINLQGEDKFSWLGKMTGGEQDSVHHNFEIEELSVSENPSVLLRCLQENSAIEKVYAEDGNHIEIYYRDNTKEVSAWTALVELADGTEGELKIEMLRSFDEPYELNTDSKLETPFSSMNLFIESEDKGPGITIDVMGVNTLATRIGRYVGWDNENMKSIYDIKDTTFEQGLVKVVVDERLNLSETSYLGLGYVRCRGPPGTGPNVPGNRTIHEIIENKVNGKLELQTGYVWIENPNVPGDSLYFKPVVNCFLEIMLRTDEGLSSSPKFSVIKHHYPYEDKADWAAYYRPIGQNRFNDVIGMMWMVNEDGRVHLQDDKFTTGYIQIRGSNYLFPQGTSTGGEAYDFKHELLRVGDEKLPDHVRLTELRDEYNLYEHTLKAEDVPYQKVDPNSGLENYLNPNSLNVYPNPADERANIRFFLDRPAELKISIQNVLGQQVRRLTKQQFYSGNVNIGFDTGNLPNGAYGIKIESSDGVLTEKLIISR
jgi:hypothetical protein